MLSGFIASVFLLLVLFVMGPLFAPLPTSVLAAIIIVAILPLFKQFASLPQLWRINKYDFFTWVVTFTTVTLLDIDIGLGIGIIFAIGGLVLNALCTKMKVLGSLDGSSSKDIYVPIDNYANAREEDQVRVMQFQGDLNFVSKERFRSQIEKLLKSQEAGNNEPRHNGELSAEQQRMTPLKEADKNENRINGDPETNTGTTLEPNGQPLSSKDRGKCQVLIIDMSCISYIDMMGITALKTVQKDLMNKMKIEVVLCSVPMSVLKKLESAGMKWLSGKTMEIFPTVTDARTRWTD